MSIYNIQYINWKTINGKILKNGIPFDQMEPSRSIRYIGRETPWVDDMSENIDCKTGKGFSLTSEWSKGFST